MDHREIRAMLRAATRDSIICGWYYFGEEPARPIEYVVGLHESGSQTFSTPEAIDYCALLTAAGVEPLYVN